MLKLQPAPMELCMVLEKAKTNSRSKGGIVQKGGGIVQNGGKAAAVGV